MNTTQLFETLLQGQNLNRPQLQETLQNIMSGQWNDVQIATFLALMRMKGETTEELKTAAEVMQQLAHFIDLGDSLVDIVGTGGDGKNTFNVSTISSFVASAAGALVAKHGNRASSSRSGSADFLSTAGFELELSDKALKHCIKTCHMAFLFGPHFHKAMQHVKTARRQLGIRTMFNLIGPLVNPAHVKRQVVGVCSKTLLQPIAEVLVSLGSEKALVVHSHDGLDEISMCAPSDLLEYSKGQFHLWTLDPKTYDLFHPDFDKILIETPLQSLKIADSVFSGKKGPARNIVILNAAATLYCALDIDFTSAIKRATDAIDQGLAAHQFNELRLLTKSLKNE